MSTNDSNRYRLLCEIGQGGMAAVHLALLSGEAGFRKLVALKRPKSGLCADPEFLEMFMNEARLAARLNHPNVVQTYEVGRHDSEPFIAMEFLEGQPLHRLQRAAPAGIPLAIHLRIIAETLAGLHHAHELRDFNGAPLSVVHRDVSPQNVLVNYDGQAKVVDFGIAKAATHASFTELGLVKGKQHYMSPEQAMGQSLDRRADVFAVGVMLWEAAARARLWPDESPRTRLRLLSLGAIPPFRELGQAVPAELTRICRRALENSPAKRYQTAAELEVDLEALRRARELHATRRDVADFMQTHFDGQRQRTRRLIESELGHFSLGGVTPKPVVVEPVGTRRVTVLPELSERTGSSLIPAMATVHEARPIRRATPRWLAGALAALAFTAVLALTWTMRPASPTLAPLVASTSAAPLPPVAAAPPPPSEPVPSASVSRKAPSRVSAAQKKASPSAPALAEPEQGLELSRPRVPAKRATRALDTSDPWGN